MKQKIIPALAILSIIFVSGCVQNSLEKVQIVQMGGEKLVHPALAKVFPAVDFYKVGTTPQTLPPSYEIVALYKGKNYSMPDDFNYLMFDYGINLTDSNKIDLAKAFIIVSRPGDYSEVKFTSESLINETRNGYTIQIKTYSRINGIIDEWKFIVWEGQFNLAERKIIEAFTGDYIEVEGIRGGLPGTVSDYFAKLIM